MTALVDAARSATDPHADKVASQSARGGAIESRQEVALSNALPHRRSMAHGRSPCLEPRRFEPGPAPHDPADDCLLQPTRSVRFDERWFG